MKFIKIIYAFFASKTGKFLIAFLVVVALFYTNFDKKYIDKDKIENTIDLIKNNKNVEIAKFINDDTKEKEITKNTEQNVVKKEIKPETYTEEEKIENVTNVFLIVNKLEALYQKRLKNKQIDYNRKVTKGSFIYYSLESIVGGKSQGKPIKFFLVIPKEDDIGFFKLFLNKKVGDVVNITLNDMFEDLEEEGGEQIVNVVDARIKDMNTVKNTNYNFNDFAQRYTILDFVPETFIKENNLDKLLSE